MTELDFTFDELRAVTGLVGVPPTRVTTREAIKLKLDVNRAMGPSCRPPRGSGLELAWGKLNRASKVGSILHRNMHDMFWTMVSLGGVWEPLDDMMDKSLGFARPDGSQRQAIYLTRFKEGWAMRDGEWARQWDAGPIRKEMRTPEGRQRVGQRITSGDHLLKFPFVHEVPGLLRVLVESEISDA